MDLKQLETFVQVAELGGFTRAAAVLRTAQPALSRQVRALELELRQPLFNRHGRGVTLTEAGKRLLAHSRGILQQVQRARQDMEDQRDAAVGVLSIGMPPSIGRSLTAPLVDAFRVQLPRAAPKLVEGLSTYLLEWLVQGRLDCAVVYNAAPAAAVELQRVLDERLYAVCARGAARGLIGRPLTLVQLAALDLVIPSRPNAIRMRIEGVLADAGLKPRVALEVESVPAMLELVQRQPLHAVLSLNAIRGSGRAEAFAARPIEPAAGQAPLATTVWIATAAQRPRGPLLERGVALLAALLQRHLGTGPRGRAGVGSALRSGHG